MGVPTPPEEALGQGEAEGCRGEKLGDREREALPLPVQEALRDGAPPLALPRALAWVLPVPCVDGVLRDAAAEPVAEGEGVEDADPRALRLLLLLRVARAAEALRVALMPAVRVGEGGGSSPPTVLALLLGVEVMGAVARGLALGAAGVSVGHSGVAVAQPPRPPPLLPVGAVPVAAALRLLRALPLELALRQAVSLPTPPLLPVALAQCSVPAPLALGLPLPRVLLLPPGDALPWPSPALLHVTLPVAAAPLPLPRMLAVRPVALPPALPLPQDALGLPLARAEALGEAEAVGASAVAVPCSAGLTVAAMVLLPAPLAVAGAPLPEAPALRIPLPLPPPLALHALLAETHAVPMAVRDPSPPRDAVLCHDADALTLACSVALPPPPLLPDMLTLPDVLRVGEGRAEALLLALPPPLTVPASPLQLGLPDWLPPPALLPLASPDALARALLVPAALPLRLLLRVATLGVPVPELLSLPLPEPLTQELPDTVRPALLECDALGVGVRVRAALELRLGVALPLPLTCALALVLHVLGGEADALLLPRNDALKLALELGDAVAPPLPPALPVAPALPLASMLGEVVALPGTLPEALVLELAEPLGAADALPAELSVAPAMVRVALPPLPLGVPLLEAVAVGLASPEALPLPDLVPGLGPACERVALLLALTRALPLLPPTPLALAQEDALASLLGEALPEPLRQVVAVCAPVRLGAAPLLDACSVALPLPLALPAPPLGVAASGVALMHGEALPAPLPLPWGVAVAAAGLAVAAALPLSPASVADARADALAHAVLCTLSVPCRLSLPHALSVPPRIVPLPPPSAPMPLPDALTVAVGAALAPAVGEAARGVLVAAAARLTVPAGVWLPSLGEGVPTALTLMLRVAPRDALGDCVAGAGVPVACTVPAAVPLSDCGEEGEAEACADPLLSRLPVLQALSRAERVPIELPLAVTHAVAACRGESVALQHAVALPEALPYPRFALGVAALTVRVGGSVAGAEGEAAMAVTLTLEVPSPALAVPDSHALALPSAVGREDAVPLLLPPPLALPGAPLKVKGAVAQALLLSRADKLIVGVAMLLLLPPPPILALAAMLLLPALLALAPLLALLQALELLLFSADALELALPRALGLKRGEPLLCRLPVPCPGVGVDAPLAVAAAPLALRAAVGLPELLPVPALE